MVNMEDYRILIFESVFISIGVIILVANFFIISEIFPLISPLFNMVGALIAIVPPFLLFYSKYKIGKEIEEQFIMFVMDLTEAIDSGMTLPIALKHSTKREYGVLTPYVKEINSKVDWGIPFEQALSIFANKVKSVPIKRSIGTIIETYKVGGKISDTLKAIGQSLIEISKIKQERSASVQAQIVTSYLIFFVFIFILVVLQAFLIPALGSATVAGGFEEAPEETPTELYSQTFVNFIIVQGFFAGLATGKMAEGSLVAGFKHSLVLIVIGYTVFSLLGQFQIRLF
jgi:flagellar protein FlaJ